MQLPKGIRLTVLANHHRSAYVYRISRYKLAYILQQSGSGSPAKRIRSHYAVRHDLRNLQWFSKCKLNHTQCDTAVIVGIACLYHFARCSSSSISSSSDGSSSKVVVAAAAVIVVVAAAAAVIHVVVVAAAAVVVAAAEQQQ
ncbi:hypothetical protein ElyMa_004255600 [Elysia marginata]|uniref:Uncharacterized protein n=1 Tax=Elysia marginata TaxID=1093978 RepID=A0AAV4GTZ3_9GAST|nr:hypothetical protein ElyMa_004255600 [Elysia marginata]